jgi:hypothetical protein
MSTSGPRDELASGTPRGSAHALCVTPEGRPELRSVTERWVRAGPAADAVWEYHPARPALAATLGIEGRRLVTGQARLHLHVDEDRQVLDVGVHHPLLRKLHKPTRTTVAFLLDWLLGRGRGAEPCWLNSVSAVILGNLLTVPIEDSLLYVQPILCRRARGRSRSCGGCRSSSTTSSATLSAWPTRSSRCSAGPPRPRRRAALQPPAPP